MQVSEFDYHLPARLIVQHPLQQRDASRLMVIERSSGRITHSQFRLLKDYLLPGDCLVANDVKVIPARLKGFKKDTKAKVEVLLLRILLENCWEVLLKPARRLREGAEIVFGEEMTGVVRKKSEGGIGVIEFQCRGTFAEGLRKLGEIPLPPYIREPLDDASCYQTVYADKEGAAAAPTAGLHFTKEAVEEIKKNGSEVVFVTLNVGLDTFQPVKTQLVEDHRIHREYYRVSRESARSINRAIMDSRRIVAVGTTSVRVLETVAVQDPGKGKWLVEAKEGWTDLFIYPGYEFKVVNALLTNFHLPRSSLLMMVSAFAGKELVMQAYRQAIQADYRFFSFGDCMLIL